MKGLVWLEESDWLWVDDIRGLDLPELRLPTFMPCDAALR
jgi:hypothetical protein